MTPRLCQEMVQLMSQSSVQHHSLPPTTHCISFRVVQWIHYSLLHTGQLGEHTHNALSNNQERATITAIIFSSQIPLFLNQSLLVNKTLASKSSPPELAAAQMEAGKRCYGPPRWKEVTAERWPPPPLTPVASRHQHPYSSQERLDRAAGKGWLHAGYPGE